MIALVALVLVVVVLVAVGMFAWLVVVPFGRALPPSLEDLRARLDAVRAADELRDLVNGLREDFDELRADVDDHYREARDDAGQKSAAQGHLLQEVYQAELRFKEGEARLDRALSKLAGTGLVGDLREESR